MISALIGAAASLGGAALSGKGGSKSSAPMQGKSDGTSGFNTMGSLNIGVPESGAFNSSLLIPTRSYTAGGIELLSDDSFLNKVLIGVAVGITTLIIIKKIK